MQIISLSSLSTALFARVFFGAYLIEHAIRISHAREGESQRADRERLFDDLIVSPDARKQARSPSLKLASRKQCKGIAHGNCSGLVGSLSAAVTLGRLSTSRTVTANPVATR